ncbi:MAG: L-serine ammonia-lyase, iron-sulfur-dependent, subunit alpha [Coriobacteriia bacterium]|nr:L-serine ammonia-lyase, iron-sulfur-dependent, subunit alpha [Coriobacteriia bacterium]
MAYLSFASLQAAAEQDFSGDLAAAALECEATDTGEEITAVRERLRAALATMREAIARGAEPGLRSRSGMTGGDGALLLARADTLGAGHGMFTRAIGSAVATAEVNAAMGRIVAAPTAGASGVLPGVLIPFADAHGISDEQLVDALAVAGAIGAVYAAASTLSGAAGGCQAEIGTGASMAAGALCYLSGGNSEQVGHAAAIAMQGQLGLVCDPVGGLVEIPCVMRNLTGTAVALAATEAALAGVKFPLSLDDVVMAAHRVGDSMPPSLRETARGGLAVTPGAQELLQKDQPIT